MASSINGPNQQREFRAPRRASTTAAQPQRGPPRELRAFAATGQTARGTASTNWICCRSMSTLELGPRA
jgi:hypothetical protein